MDQWAPGNLKFLSSLALDKLAIMFNVIKTRETMAGPMQKRKGGLQIQRRRRRRNGPDGVQELNDVVNNLTVMGYDKLKAP